MDNPKKRYELKQLQDALAEKKSILRYNKEQIKYAMSPIGSAIYACPDGELLEDSDIIKLKPKELKKPKHWSDRIECKICGKTYQRSRTTLHKRTQFHRTYDDINEKLRKVLL